MMSLMPSLGMNTVTFVSAFIEFSSAIKAKIAGTTLTEIHLAPVVETGLVKIASITTIHVVEQHWQPLSQDIGGIELRF